MIGSKITGLGVELPARRSTNAEVAQELSLPPEWIEQRTGIRERRIAGPNETSATMGTSAARRALDAAGLSGADIDLIICATVTAPSRFPATASLIQHGIGSHAAAFDLNAACSGFLYALAQADGSIRAGGARRVLVVGADTMSRLTDRTDPATAVLFGDGAGAAIVEPADGDRLGPFKLFSDGSRPELLHVSSETETIKMRGRDVYRAAVTGMADSVAALLDAAGMSPREVDLVVAHQANARILQAVAARLDLPPGKMFSNIGRYGNTSAASIPIALHEAHQSGAVKENDAVVLAAFGAGFAWGAGLARWAIPRARTEVLIGAGAARG